MQLVNIFTRLASIRAAYRVHDIVDEGQLIIALASLRQHFCHQCWVRHQQILQRQGQCRISHYYNFTFALDEYFTGIQAVDHNLAANDCCVLHLKPSSYS